MKKILSFLLFCFISIHFAFSASTIEKKVLVLVEGDYNLKSMATGQGRQLVQLLGHFNTLVDIKGVNAYQSKGIEKYDYVFYVGFSPEYKVPSAFEQDILQTTKPIVWINTGFVGFSANSSVAKKFGFYVSEFQKTSIFNAVNAEGTVYAKGTPDINLIKITDKKLVEVWANALSTKTKKETPYMVKSGNLIYVADLPFLGATERDRYLFFADKLHDILNEKHEEKHQAIIRIEDVTPLHNPDKLREIADILSERGIPFLVGVVPIYVNPSEDRRVTLTEKPELVDALKYMVRNGGSIVMHGVTHQYKGISTDDYEFWDGALNKPIHDENADDISRRIEMGLDEFVKNGLYPVAWETPHYTASIITYETVSKYFSTVVEQRMTMERYDYGQYFPYIINKDIYGQKIYPENLGYIPLDVSLDSSKAVVNRIIANASMIHKVRDGVSSCFFHPFLDLGLLKQLVDGFQANGYSFIDLREQTNWVKLHDKVILTGSQPYSLKIDNSYLHEVLLNKSDNIIKKDFSPARLNGLVSRNVTLKPGEMMFAEGIDYHIKELTLKDKIVKKVKDSYTELFTDMDWHEARVSLCWNQYAKGAAFNDQSSFAAMFKSLNINVDTIFNGESLDLKNSNLLVVPYGCVDSLTLFDYDKIERFVKNGGNLITDRKNKLIEKFGIKFFPTESKIQILRDRYYPEDPISWKYSQLVNKFDYNDDDEVFCEDAISGLAAAIGRKYEKGKIIYFNTAFDPNTPFGYSNYPFAMDYVKKYLKLLPVVKRENLEVYFDPGLRQNSSVENLVKIWVKQGVRFIHIAAWHQYPKFNYDYKRVIKLAHENGMLVYAWIEPPQVSQKFWENHPEFREKNYKNEDVRPSWRYPVALTDEKCLSAITTEYVNFLKESDWDGVNIGELYFEAGKGFENPNLFTPMHSSAIKEFKAKYGFDMKQVFNPASEYYWKKNQQAKAKVVNYRVDKITSIHDKLLGAIYNYAKTKQGFNVIVTFMDSHFSPEILEYYGVNIDHILALHKKYGFGLQAEDPQSKWSTEPDRYVDFGKYYASKIADSSKLFIDLNILNFRTKDEVTPFPTSVQTGIESYQLVNFSATVAPRVTIYSEATCNPQDLSLFSYASSAQVKYQYTENGYEVNSPYSFVLQLPVDLKIINVDGKAMIGSRNNMFLIPAGKHSVKCKSDDLPGFSTVELQPQILSFTGNLLDIRYDMRKIAFDYESTERTLVSLNRLPTTISVDNQNYSFNVMKGNDCFSVYLPVGKHTVEIVTGDKFTYGINVTSLWSSSAIAIYGTLAALSLLLMFLILKLLRKRLER